MAEDAEMPVPGPLYKTFRFRVKDATSGKHLTRMARGVNTVWNHCNGAQTHALEHNATWPTSRQLQDLTKGSGALLGISSQTVQAVCQEYAARRKQAGKAKLRWRGKGSLGWVPFKDQTFELDGTVAIYAGHRFHLWKHRDLEGRIKWGSFAEDARGRWYCNIVCEIEPPKERHPSCVAVGGDLGLKTWLTLSTGKKIEHPRAYRTLEAELAAAQRANKKRRVRAIHARIANVRRDFLHKETTKIADEFGAIFIGNVSASRTRSARSGIITHRRSLVPDRPPGVRDMAVNGKSASDASWGLSHSLLRYKAIARGGVYGDVSEYLSTQACSECHTLGGPQGAEGLVIREWTCGQCGSVHDRDVNAARNILRAGLRTLAEGAPAEGRVGSPALQGGE